jgi:plasmid stability protein
MYGVAPHRADFSGAFAPHRAVVPVVPGARASTGTGGTSGVAVPDAAGITSFTLRLDSELWRRVKVVAAHEDRSAAEWVRVVLDRAVAASERRVSASSPRQPSTARVEVAPEPPASIPPQPEEPLEEETPPEPLPRPRRVTQLRASAPSEPPDDLRYGRAGCPRTETRGVRCSLCGEVHRA